MNRSALVLALSLGLIFAGCRGPRFNPRATSALPGGAEGAPIESVSTPNAVDDARFTPVALTNQITATFLTPPKDFYRLGPGDLIQIQMIGEGARDSALVGPDGKIYYNILPGTSVWGLTLTETKQTLEKALGKYLRVVPDLSIILTNVASQTVWVLGNVQTPGIYPLSAPTTLLEAIAAAGGPISPPGAPDGVCDLKRSFVMRDGQLLGVDFERLLRGGDMSQNIYLRPSDFVYLRSGVIRSVYVMGAVAAPQAVPFAHQMSLMTAILTCGGTVPYAYLSQVAIVRGSLTRPTIAVVNLRKIRRGGAGDIKLQAGDIVYIPFVPWQKLAIFANNILQTFVSTLAMNEGYRAVYPRANPLVPTLQFPVGGNPSLPPGFNPGSPYYSPGSPY